MRPEDLSQYLEVFPEWRDRLEHEIPEKIAVLSPSSAQLDIVRLLFPGAEIKSLTADDWDLNQEGTEDFDLILAMNVFMYSSDPWKWFKNVFSRCKYFWMQDVIRTQRAPDGHLGTDGDHQRFSYRPEACALTPDACELSSGVGDRAIEFVVYESSSEFDKRKGQPGQSFLLFLRGDL